MLYVTVGFVLSGECSLLICYYIIVDSIALAFSIKRTQKEYLQIL